MKFLTRSLKLGSILVYQDKTIAWKHHWAGSTCMARSRLSVWVISPSDKGVPIGYVSVSLFSLGCWWQILQSVNYILSKYVGQ